MLEFLLVSLPIQDSLFLPSQDGEHYHFTTREAFESGIERGDFLEHAHVHANIYGTSVQAVRALADDGRCCVLDIDVQGARQVCFGGGDGRRLGAWGCVQGQSRGGGSCAATPSCNYSLFLIAPDILLAFHVRRFARRACRPCLCSSRRRAWRSWRRGCGAARPTRRSRSRRAWRPLARRWTGGW